MRRFLLTAIACLIVAAAVSVAVSLAFALSAPSAFLFGVLCGVVSQWVALIIDILRK